MTRSGGRAVGRSLRMLAGFGVLLSVPPSGRLTAQAVDRTKPPVLGPAPTLRPPTVRPVKLPNGLTLAVIEMHKVPVVDVQIIIGAGAARDPADLPGLASFTAAMLDQGAGARSAFDVADETAFLGAQYFAGADFDNAVITLHVPKRQLGPALDLLADIVLRPTFADSEVARQRSLRRSQILQQRDNPVAMAGVAFPAIVFGAAHPYGRPLAGTDSSVERLTRDRVAAFYSAYYRPENAKVLVVGDITPEEARTMLAARFGAWAGAPVAAPPAATAPAAGPRTIYVIDKPGAAQSVIRIGQAGVARSTPDYFVLQVLNTILGGSFTSRLNQNLRETHGYTYGASSGFAMRRLAGPFQAAASVVTAKTDSALIEFLKELRRIRDVPVPAEELEKAKHYIILGLPGDFETTAGTASRFRDLLAYDVPLSTYQDYVNRIRAVTAADVQGAARQYLDPEHFAIVVVGDRVVIEAGLRALNEGPIAYRDMWGHAVP
ncbi:MAG TPA: pitrilysin family protein [Gemmatimonadales bacterium]